MASMANKTCKHTFYNNAGRFVSFLSRFKGKQGPEMVVQWDQTRCVKQRAYRVSSVRDTLGAILFNDF